MRLQKLSIQVWFQLEQAGLTGEQHAQTHRRNAETVDRARTTTSLEKNLHSKHKIQTHRTNAEAMVESACFKEQGTLG